MTSLRSRVSLATLATLAAVVVGGTALAQQSSTNAIDFKLNTGYEHTFGTGIDNGGDFDAGRFRIGVTGKTNLARDLDMSMHLGYEYSTYGFEGTTTFGGTEPWEDINTIDLGAIFTYNPANDWSLWTGPIFRFSSESGADFGDGFSGGGVGGMTLELSDDFIIGGGFGFVSRLEENPKLFPIIIIEWSLTDDLHLSTRGASRTLGKSGIELIYDVAPDWELAAGAAYETRVFRLDDEGTGPDGAGEQTGLPIWGRISYNMADNINIDFYGGMVVDGSMKIRNSLGVDIGHEDYETAGYVGISANIKF